MTTHTLHGSCHCRCIRVDVTLPRATASYTPRACDCSFCRKHGASYVSDPTGTLRIHLHDSNALGRYRQGNGLAEFLLCKTCGVLVGVAYEEDGQTFATLNSLVIDGGASFLAPTAVSPQTLGADAKIARWKAFWFADVALSTEAASSTTLRGASD